MNPLHQQLLNDHRNLEKVLDVLEHEVALFAREERCEECQPDLPLIRDILDYVNDYPEAFHHPLEEAAMDHLLEKDVGKAEQISSIRAEHEDLEEVSSRLKEMIEAIDGGTPVPLARLRDALRDFHERQQQHIYNEENTIFEAIGEIDNQTCDSIMARLGGGKDPLFARDTAPQYRELIRYIDTHR